MTAQNSYKKVEDALHQASVVHTRLERMRQKLEEALTPSHLVIRDESARHAGHAGVKSARQKARGPSVSSEESLGETHYRIAVTSAAFTGLSIVAQHRLVHRILVDEFASGLHALSLQTVGSVATSGVEADDEFRG